MRLFGGGDFVWSRVNEEGLAPHVPGSTSAAAAADALRGYALRKAGTRAGAGAKRAAAKAAAALSASFSPPWDACSDSEADEDTAAAAEGDGEAAAGAGAGAGEPGAARDGLTPDWIIDAGCASGATNAQEKHAG